MATIMTDTMNAGPIGPPNPTQKHSAEDFSQAGRRREEPSWAEAELLKERPCAGQAIPSEPAEELLRSMCRHQNSKQQSNKQQSNRHVIPLSFTICITAKNIT